jgi:competence protein ComEC
VGVVVIGVTDKLQTGESRALLARVAPSQSGWRTLFETARAAARDALPVERDRLILWAPVAFAFGAALCAGPRAGDPVAPWLWGVGLALAFWSAAQIAGSRANGRAAGRALAALAFFGLLLTGFCGGASAVLLRAQAAAAPVLDRFLPATTLIGHVEAVDRNRNGAWRARIAVQAWSAPSAPPRRVRISLKGAPPMPGEAVRCRASLRPPPGPVAPGAHDFARRAWFQGLGAVGYALEECAPVSLRKPGHARRLAMGLAAARAAVARRIVAHAPTPGGALLAAVATGDRALMDEAETEALQVSGLSHIVSVSGLHVALVSGLVFLTVWRALALIGPLALRVDARKAAAIAGFSVALLYTIFTGAEAPAVRACVMAGVAFGAIVLDRKALTMRGLAVAAMLVLAVRPESAIEPGFQMSFLATAALVALWETIDRRGDGGPVPPLVRAGAWLAGAAGASLVAGLATAPIAAATFHRLAPYGLPSNLLAAPITDFWVGPLAVAAAALSPLGWDGPFWALSAKGLDLILAIARVAQGLPGAESVAPWTGPLAPLLLSVAVLWAALWRSTPMRALAAPLALAGLGVWAGGEKPVGWIAPGATAVLATPLDAPASLCRTRGSRFDASRLLDAAALATAEVERLNPARDARIIPRCRVGEGDWEARYLDAERGPATLAVSLDGRTHAFGAGDLAEGALVMRRGWRVRLVTPPPGRAPWRRAQAGAAAD